MSSRRPIRTSLTALVAAGALLVPAAALQRAAAPETGGTDAARVRCPSGTVSYADYLQEERRVEAVTSRGEAARFRALADRLLAAGGPVLDGCIPVKHPESFQELMAAAVDRAIPRVAGMGDFDDGAFAAAVRERSAMTPGSVPGTAGTGSQYGTGPLDATFFGTEGLGIPIQMGRTDDLEYDDFNDFLFAAVGTGGVWVSPDRAEHWFEINGNLPMTSVYSIAWTPAGGGRLVAITGEGSYGANSIPGVGAYWTDSIGSLDRDNIRSEDVVWHQAEGVPEGGQGFRVAVDKAHPDNVYIAMSKGLFRSTDAGSTFVNAELPVGPCKGVTNTSSATGGRPECHFANWVTDVAVQEPGGTGSVTEPIVIAAVGWRGGNRTNPDGTVQSPNNGVYRSTDGGVTFTKVDPTTSGFAQQSKIGRTEFGIAYGDNQDHGYVWAIVQDADALNGLGCAVTDAPIDCSPSGAPTGINTVLDGIYASPDFGATWLLVATAEDFQNPGSGSQLNGAFSALGYQPGVQAWYNQALSVDPTSQTVGGVPTRLIIGLEEVWENSDSETPNGTPPQKPPLSRPTTFRVIGRYFAGDTCMIVGGLPVCPAATQDPIAGSFTTHPDQQSAIQIPTDTGVQLIMGNDGGTFSQTATAGVDYEQSQWGRGKVEGFQTLLPYHVEIARDGRAWFGLQDNGSGFVDPEDGYKQKQSFGGDGFYTAVDPFNSDIAYFETPGASMNVTLDGGSTSAGVAPPAAGGPYRFSNPFKMDANSALHLATGGSMIVETIYGAGTTSEPPDPDPVTGEVPPIRSSWVPVFDLGEIGAPGVAVARPELPTDPEIGPLNSMSAIDVERNAIYAGFCGVCDILNVDTDETPFFSGLATNVGGDLPERAMRSDGWHVATAEGLPNRFITSVEIDPRDPRIVYVTLGGYSRQWVGPGTIDDQNPDVGEGHVFKSTDAGETFVDWTGNLPDVTATWVTLRGDQLLIATDVGAFASRSDGAPVYAPLEDVPSTPVGNISVQPGNPNRAVLSLYGRGVWIYDFDDKLPVVRYERLAGADRILTAIEVSKQEFDAADTVVIATTDTFADALAAVPMAAWANAPILLTGRAGLAPAVAAEVSRLGATRALVVGGTATLSEQVNVDLASLGLTTQRIAGANRFATAAAIAERVPVPSTAYLVEGASATGGWPDALTIGPLAGTQGHPILLMGGGALPPETQAAIDDLGVESVIAAGGSAVIPDSVLQGLEDSGIETRRYAGANRFETNTVIAKEALGSHHTDHRLFVARADSWADALAAGAAISVNGGTLLLTNTNDFLSSGAVVRWVREHSSAVEAVYFLGGKASISTTAESQIRASISAGPPPPPVPNPLVGEELARYTFDIDGEGWLVGGFGSGQWQLRSPGDTSTQAWHVEPYENETTAILQSPPIEHPGGTVKVSWRAAFRTEDGFDYLTASWSTDGVVFNGLGSGVTGQNAAYPLYDDFSGTFYAPRGEIYIRYTLSSDQLVNDAGVSIDNVVVQR